MSIASNVILENTRLGTTRTKIRNKLTEYNIWWDNSLTIFELAERLVMMFAVTISSIVKLTIITPGGFDLKKYQNLILIQLYLKKQKKKKILLPLKLAYPLNFTNSMN